MSKLVACLWVLVSVLMAQPVIPATHVDPDVIVTTGGVVDYFQHQAASISSVSFKATSVAGLPTFSTTSIMFTPAKNANGSISANGVTIKSGVTQVVWHRGIVDMWVNSEIGVTKFDFATLGNFDGATGISFDVGNSVTKGKCHVYVTPFAREVSIVSKEVKPVFGLMIGTGFSRNQ